MTVRPPFERVLVANRGEIAVRLCRGLVELGIEPVAVFSDADRDAAHVAAAPRSYALGGDTPAESYLCVDKLIAAARATGAQAVHPGYGFLSENAEFARAVAAAGLTFIGPSPETIELLGSKAQARAVAVAAGVPPVPGFDGSGADAAAMRAAADEIGFPLLVKAVAGGGGKGMRIVTCADEFVEALAAGRREALAAFGDDRMLLEKLLSPARHVEIQILGDASGKVVAIGERECSVQRRHQKVIEEAPSPAVDNDLRQRMCASAVALAEQVGYASAGTVEFLLDRDGSYYFLEVNTRLQVEHPVTELVAGIDLVHLQVEIAAGGLLVDLLPPGDLSPRGHAIEVRVYAEEPERGYLPAAGRLARVVEPEGPGVRVDSGVRAGIEVSPHYDPLLAKLIVHAPSREAACRRMARALADLTYLGVATNVDFLQRVIADPDFRSGDLSTDFLDRKPQLAQPAQVLPPAVAYVAAALCQSMSPERGGVVRDRAASPWETAGPVRLWEADR